MPKQACVIDSAPVQVAVAQYRKNSKDHYEMCLL